MFHSSTMLPEYFKIVPKAPEYYKNIAEKCLLNTFYDLAPSEDLVESNSVKS